MSIDFSSEYAKRSNEELLRLASERASLTETAVAALDAELIRRRLTKSDEDTFQRAEKQYESRRARKALRKALGTQRSRADWFKNLVLVLIGFFVITLASTVHQTLPAQYQFDPDRREQAFTVMAATVFIVVFGFSWWRRASFWLSLVASSSLHFFLVQRWLVDRGSQSRSGTEKTALLLGFLLFFVFYGSTYLFKKRFRSAEAAAQNPDLSG